MMRSRTYNAWQFGGAQRPILPGMEGGSQLPDRREEIAPPEPCRSRYVTEPRPGYRRVQVFRRGPLPSPVAPLLDTRLVDLLPGMKKAPQPILVDVLGCLVSLFLPRGGQYDQRIHYAH
jgi:hypothetical protein